MAVDLSKMTREEKIARLEKIRKVEAMRASQNQEPGVENVGVTDGATPAAEQADWTDASIPGTNISARTLGQATANSLPVMGSMAGAIGAGALATPETLGAGTIPAGFAGAAGGGVAGVSLKKALENYFNKQNPIGYKASALNQLKNFLPPTTVEGWKSGLADAGDTFVEGAKTGLESELGGQIFNKVAPVFLPYAASQFSGLPEETVRTYMNQAPQVMKMALESKLPGQAIPNVGRLADRLRRAMDEKLGIFREEQGSVINNALQGAEARGVTHDIGPNVSALESNRLSIPAGAYPEENAAVVDAASRLKALTPGPRAPTLPEKKSVSEYLGNYKTYLQQKNAYKRALGLAGEDLAQPALPGLTSDLQHVSMSPRMVELQGQAPQTMAAAPAPTMQNQMFLPDMPTGNSEAARLFAKPGDANFGDLGGDAANRLGTRASDALAGPAQREFLNQNTAEQLSLFGKQGEIDGTGIVPRNYAEVVAPKIDMSHGQTNMLYPPVRPVRPETPWAEHSTVVTPEKLYESKKLLQDLGKGKYAPPGTVFNTSGKGAEAIKGQASALRAKLHDAHPEVAGADAKLEQLHILDENMQKALHMEGQPTGALVAAGSGKNIVARNQLEDLGNLTGNDFLGEAQRLAAVQHFGRPQVMPNYHTGEIAKSILGGPMSSPWMIKKMIDMGLWTNPNYARAITPYGVSGAANLAERLNPWASSQEGK